MIDRVNTSQLQDILANAAAKQARNAEPAQNRSADASLQADYAALIKQAAATCADSRMLLHKAEELLNTGQLETPENISQAARNIAQFGV
jgi:hypothetical protein